MWVIVGHLFIHASLFFKVLLDGSIVKFCRFFCSSFESIHYGPASQISAFGFSKPENARLDSLM